MEECDLNYSMTRDKFEEVSAPIFNEIANILTQMAQRLKEKNI
jgi:molecular chaperone DnaK (HSP70)